MIKKIFLATAIIGFSATLFFGGFKPNGYVSTNREPLFVNPFDKLRIEAQSVYVFDLVDKKPLFELNSHAQLPLASITKIMTITVASDFLPKEEKEKMRETIDAALVHSSNNAAIALASRAENFMDGGDFIWAMNKKARELKLNQTFFLNETGLDISEDLGGAYGSAVDVVDLISYAARNNASLLEATTYEQVGAIVNTNINVANTTQLIASKTGFTDLAGGNLTVIFDAGLNHPVAIAVLGSSKEGRFSDVEKLIQATFLYLTNNM